MKTTSSIESSAFRQTGLGLLLMLLMLALVFSFHGSQKLFGLFGGYGLEGTAQWMGSRGLPLPMLSASLASGTELLGGLALLFGLAQRSTAVLLGFTMLVAAWIQTGFSATSAGMESPLTLALVSLGLASTGSGRFTLQAARHKS